MQISRGKLLARKTWISISVQDKKEIYCLDSNKDLQFWGYYNRAIKKAKDNSIYVSSRIGGISNFPTKDLRHVRIIPIDDIYHIYGRWES